MDRNVEDTSSSTVVLEEVSGKWNSEETELSLDNVSLTSSPGKLVAIIGPVGSGKSSIIQAVLGEFPSSRGNISVSGKISYSPQESWVFSGSVRQNIIFGMDFDEARYWQVVEACALKHDFSQWEFGDRTLVGERGVSLSGGQKARVSLARAVYRNADTYLLDDPLSAVDVHVGRHLFNNCIRGFLKSKAVILVTHQLQYLQDADQIIVLKSGKVEDKGSFQHLLKNGMDFSSFLSEEDKEEDDDDIMKKAKIRTLSLTSDTHSLMSEMSQSNPHNVAIQTVVEEESNEDKKEAVEPLKQTQEQESKLDPKQVKEQRSSGSVKASVYSKYFTSGGGWFSLIILILMNLICQCLYSGSDIWLAYWTSKEELKILAQQSNSSLQTLQPSLKHNLPAPALTLSDNTTTITDIYEEEYLEEEHFFNLAIYATIVLCLIVSSMIRTMHFFSICMKSSVKLHDSMFSRILRAPCRFFDTNPVGRILNRFSKDMGSMDELLPPAFFDVISVRHDWFMRHVIKISSLDWSDDRWNPGGDIRRPSMGDHSDSVPGDHLPLAAELLHAQLQGHQEDGGHRQVPGLLTLLNFSTG